MFEINTQSTEKSPWLASRLKKIPTNSADTNSIKNPEKEVKKEKGQDNSQGRTDLESLGLNNAYYRIEEKNRLKYIYTIDNNGKKSGRPIWSGYDKYYLDEKTGDIRGIIGVSDDLVISAKNIKGTEQKINKDKEIGESNLNEKDQKPEFELVDEIAETK